MTVFASHSAARTPDTTLAYYYRQVDAIILSRQHPISGLLPASTAVNAHGDYTDAWVRDNVYSILAAWGLALAYRKAGSDAERQIQLEQSVVKLMRGLLVAMMKQSDKVERFKHTQKPVDALHAKYDTASGDPVVGDEEWGHLQVDATSLFLLMLAQMTASGLRIVFTVDEVNFVQNLVHYIGRAYRTPDYGIWERGNKINHGIPELNASSIGMAKAALEAMDGFNVFGVTGGAAGTIHVIPDEIARARITLESILPRESGSKETDAALLSIIGFPAFAVRRTQLVDQTRETIIQKLAGSYGCKRFLLDGHQTVLEDTSRLHYEPAELKQFEHIESEWPLFFTYLVLDGLFRGDTQQAAHYRERLESLFVERDGVRLLPELYFVPADRIAAEKANPRTQVRQANENVPLVWAQSLFLLGALIQDGLISVEDVDPLNRRLRPAAGLDSEVLVAVLADGRPVQRWLAERGIRSETLEEVAPTRVFPAEKLSAALACLGQNARLGLSGRPLRRLRSMATSKVFQVDGQDVLFAPQMLNARNYYLARDSSLLAETLRSELLYIRTHWNGTGQPLVTLMLTENMTVDEQSAALAELLREIQGGKLSNGVTVRTDKLRKLIAVAATERLDYLPDACWEPSPPRVDPKRCEVLAHDPAATALLTAVQASARAQSGSDQLLRRLALTRNLHESIEILELLWHSEGPEFITGLGGPDCAVHDLVEEVYRLAGEHDLWSVVRRSAALLDKHDETLEDAVVEILVRQKQLAVGRSYSADALIRQPAANAEILEKIREYCGEDGRERVLNQEIVLYLGMLIKSEPALFSGMLTLRSGHFIQLLVGQLARENNIPQHKAFERLLSLSPRSVLDRLRHVLFSYRDMVNTLARVESLHTERDSPLMWVRFPAEADPLDLGPDASWRNWRELNGMIARLSDDFFQGVWELLHHCPGIVVGDRFNSRNTLERELIHGGTTAGERNFAFEVEHLLNKISAPDYRQLNIEALRALIHVMRANPELQLNDFLVLDALIGHAVRLAWLNRHPQEGTLYNEKRSEAWESFYEAPPHQIANAIMAALAFLLDATGDTDPDEGTDAAEDIPFQASAR